VKTLPEKPSGDIESVADDRHRKILLFRKTRDDQVLGEHMGLNLDYVWTLHFTQPPAHQIVRVIRQTVSQA
jgi:hypothetical protein